MKFLLRCGKILTIVLKEQHIALQNKVASFADREIANRTDLLCMEAFPFDIWHRMGEEKLLGLSLPKSFKGTWHDYLSIIAALESFVRYGRNMGLALSWTIHLIVSRLLILGFGNREQHDRYLNRLAKGDITAAIAVSEPGTGTNPKHMKTFGDCNGEHYILNGEKSFISNGPIADLFVVFAITGKRDARKEITAFLIPVDTPGLTVGETVNLEFLRPSLHCGITLMNCSIPKYNILGNLGSAYEDMVKPFRELEEVLLMGSLLGGMNLQLDLLLSHIQKHGINITDELKECVGELHSIAYTMRVISYDTACILNNNVSQSDHVPLMLSSRMLIGYFESKIKQLMDIAGIDEDSDLYNITNDLTKIVNIGKGVRLIKQRKIGDMLLSKR